MSVLASGPDINHLGEIAGLGSAESIIEAMNFLGWTVVSPSCLKLSLAPRANPSNQGAQQQ